MIPRIGSAITFTAPRCCASSSCLAATRSNESVAITRARDKLRSLQLLARQGIDLPITGFAHSPDDTGDLIELVGGAPAGGQAGGRHAGYRGGAGGNPPGGGKRDRRLRGLNAHILVREYVREARGRDVRCLVVGGQVVAAIERQAKPGEFRSNLHRGGTARQVTITARERAIAVKAANTLGLDVAGVDILRAERGRW